MQAMVCSKYSCCPCFFLARPCCHSILLSKTNRLPHSRVLCALRCRKPQNDSHFLEKNLKFDDLRQKSQEKAVKADRIHRVTAPPTHRPTASDLRPPTSDHRFTDHRFTDHRFTDPPIHTFFSFSSCVMGFTNQIERASADHRCRLFRERGWPGMTLQTIDPTTVSLRSAVVFTRSDE